MANSTLEIANLALIRLGQRSISDLSGTARDAVIMNALMAGTIKEVLSTFAWNCAITRVKLAKDTEVTNLTEFQHAYELPADMVRCLDLDGDKKNTYRIEGGYIFTDTIDTTDDTVVMRYIKTMPTVTDWDEILEEAVVTRLAEKACIAVTQNLNLNTILKQSYGTILSIAQQGATEEDREDLTGVLTQLGASMAQTLQSDNNYANG